MGEHTDARGAAGANGTIITGANIFSGDSSAPFVGFVVIDDDRITEVGEGSPSMKGRAGHTKVDANGRWLIPGLIDAHVHLCYAYKGTPAATADEALAAGVANAETKLRTGVTTVRDVGAFWQLNLRLKSMIHGREVAGPRMLASGDFLATPTGHCSYWARQVTSVDDVGLAVDEQVDGGADLIKIMASAGVADADEDPTLPQLSRQEVERSVEAASRRGVPVAAHAHPEAAILNAVNAGCSTIEHGTYLTEALVELMIARGVAVVPTLAVYDRMASGVDGNATRNLARQIWDEKVPRLTAAIAQGIRIGVGTDSGSNYPADGIVREMELMCELGMTAGEVLVAATSGNAAILGVADLTGSILAGRSADMVLLGSNPLEDIGNCRDVQLVIARGEHFFFPSQASQTAP